jgi:hypothetical protein
VNRLNILRQVTKPMTEAEVKEVMRLRYGNVRENMSNDDPVTARAGDEMTKRKAKLKTEAITKRPG